MKSAVILALAAAATAQVSYDPGNGTFTCDVADMNYCASESLQTDIIIRCSGTVGQPGRCTNNLAGQPPLGVQPARCWQSSPTAGDAACEKNCVVYGVSTTFTLPASECTPYYTPVSSASVATATASDTTVVPTITASSVTVAPPLSTGVTGNGTTTAPPTYTTITYTSGTGTAGTIITTTVPVGHNSTVSLPSLPSPSQPLPTGAAAANKAAGALAALGAVAAFFL